MCLCASIYVVAASPSSISHFCGSAVALRVCAEREGSKTGSRKSSGDNERERGVLKEREGKRVNSRKEVWWEGVIKGEQGRGTGGGFSNSLSVILTVNSSVLTSLCPFVCTRPLNKIYNWKQINVTKPFCQVRPLARMKTKGHPYETAFGSGRGFLIRRSSPARTCLNRPDRLPVAIADLARWSSQSIGGMS